MKRKVLSVVLTAIMLTQSAPIYAEYSYEDAREELAWIYEQIPEEVDESSEGYRPDKVWKEFYVSNTGKDTNDGSINAPFATIKRAQEEVRKFNDDMQGDIVVHIESGEYYMDEKIIFGVDDSGTNGYNIVWLGDKENMPIISGGKKLDTMKPSSEYPGIYEVKVDYPDRILNLYVNGHSREVAAGNNFVYGQKRPAYMRTNEWYAKYPLDRRLDEEYFDPNTSKDTDGVYVKKEDMCIYDNIEDVFVVYNCSYKTYVVGIEEMFENPDNKDQYIVRYTGGWEFLSRSTTPIWPSGDKPFRVKNAFELLDSPGEFYFNKKTQTLYYMPYEDEDMATAEVIMPYQENLFSICGDDRENKVHNLVFEGLEFAHTMWNRWSYDGLSSNYGTTDLNNGADGLQAGMPAYAVSVGFADNITFKNNYFFGIGGNALWVPAETKYLKVLGNAFADIGDTGFLADGYSGNVLDFGNDNYYKAGTPNEEQKNKPLELTGTSYATLEVSYDDAVLGSNGKFMLGKHVLVNMDRWESWDGPVNKTWVDEYDYPENAWRSDPKAPEKGEKSWIKYDFGSAYSVDKIALAFAENIVQDEEKTNYEILLSNDMYFSEGQYKTVVQQTTPANTIQEYEIKETEKYRYMMIRTMGATPLAVSGVWAFSYDKKPYPAESNSSYMYVQNNKFSRMGINVENSAAVTMNFVSRKVVTHNEIDTTAYCGMQLLGGQSSNERQSHKYGYIAHNYITNTNKMLPDGSGFYVHGHGQYNICEENYLQSNGVGVFGYYTDGGASAWTFVNNIAEDVPTSYGFYYRDANNKNSTMGNISRLMYANHDTAISVEVPEKPGHADYYWPLVQNDAEAPRVYLRGQPIKEVYAIKKNAGLEPEFEWIRDLIPDDTDHNLDPYLYFVEAIHESENAGNRRRNSMKYEAENIIANGVFGVGLGKFDVMYKEKLTDAVNDINSTNNTNIAEKDIILRKLLREVAESVERYSLEETLQLCKELAAASVVDDSKTPGFDTVSSENLKAFTDVITEIENRMKETYDYSDEFEMLITLETAYNNFNDQCRSADIRAVVVPDAENVVIDKEKLKVDIYVPSNIDLDDVKDVEYILSGKAEIGRVFYDDDRYSKGLNVPVYCKEVGKYKYWTVTVKHSEPIESSFVSADSFVSASIEGIKTKKSKSGGVLAASPYPNMSKTYDTDLNGAKVLFKPFAVTDNKKFTFIVGASFVDGYSINNITELYNRIELEFNNDIVNIYSVVKGKKTLIKSAKSNIKYNEKNEFSYSFKKINDTKCLTLKLNGNTILNDALVEKIDDCYFGIYSPNINVEIIDAQ